MIMTGFTAPIGIGGCKAKRRIGIGERESMTGAEALLKRDEGDTLVDPRGFARRISPE